MPERDKSRGLFSWSQEQAESYLENLRAHKEAVLEIIYQAEQRRYEIEKQFSELVQKTKQESRLSEINAYKSSAQTLGKLLGLGIKQMAMVMIPFEIAEATKEMANFLATRDPSHLAASLKHALAVKQYAQAAKTSKSVSTSAGALGRTAPRVPRAQEKALRQKAHIVVNVGDGVVVHPKEFARQIIEGLNEAYRDNVVIEFAG